MNENHKKLVKKQWKLWKSNKKKQQKLYEIIKFFIQIHKLINR